ncbi:aldehyde dehydrogenase, partial [Streptomyces tanashiensis]
MIWSRTSPRTAPAAVRPAVTAAALARNPPPDRKSTREQGKPLAESRAEIVRTAARLRYFADLVPR